MLNIENIQSEPTNEPKLEILNRFIKNVEEYHSSETTLGRARELAIILEEEINILTDIFEMDTSELSQIYKIAKGKR